MVIILLASFLSMITIVTAPLPTGNIVGWWKFDEGTGTTVTDSSPYGNDGTITGTPNWVPGKFGTAMYFDGSNYVTIPDDSELEPTTEISVEAWVKRSGTPGPWCHIISKQLTMFPSWSSYGLYSGPSGGIMFYIGFDGSPQYQRSANVPAATVWDGEWHHVMGIYDGADVKLYFDGSLVTPVQSSPEDIYYQGTGDLLIGHYSTGPSYAFDGYVDEVRIWDKALSADEVQDIYAGITLSSNGILNTGHFCEVWDLTQSDLIISFSYDANGLIDDPGAHAWGELGIRTYGSSDYNPTGQGIWVATDFEYVANTFDPDPAGSPSADLDDKLILQKAGGHGEGDYNLPSTPPAPGNNHRIWFDRDGVDQWQAQNPLAVDGGTYNTHGNYNVVLTLHATSPTTGTAYMTINGLDQGFETDGNWKTMELTPAGMTFTGDMTQMQVFYGLYGYGATHSITFSNIVVEGIQNPLSLNFDSSSTSILELGSTATLTVQATDTYGEQIEGILVDFESDPTGLTIPSATTDTDGYATTQTTPTIPGVYTITATTPCGLTDEWTLVVFDPAGMAAGGGWYYPLDDQDQPMGGRANFGFIAKYIKGNAKGNLEFQYKQGDINLKSTEITWLVVSGANAQFKGIANLNGEPGYHFRVKAHDNGEPGAGSDTFAIKIWDGDPDDPATTLIHSSHNTIEGGNIMIKTK